MQMAVAPEAVSVDDVEEAARRIAGKVRETPLLRAGELSRRVGARVLLKAENLQLTGSFKARGATNVIAAAAARRRCAPAWWRRARATTRRRWPARRATRAPRPCS